MRAAWGAAVVAALLLVGAASGSCYNPNFVSGVTKCSSTGACPNDWVCQSGVCVDVTAGGAGGSTPAGGHGGSPSTGGHGGSPSTGGHGGGTSTGGHGGGGAGGASSGGTGGASSGSGGAVSSGGATGTGGTPSTGGASGAAGSSATCIQGATMKPPTALITDFSDAVPDSTRPAGDFSFGSTTGFPGGTARYASGAVGTASLSNGQLIFTATVEAATTANMYPFNGIVVFMSGMECIDASQYTGVSFDLALSGTCSTIFQFSDSEHTLQTNDIYRGTCPPTTASCFDNQYNVNSGHNKIAFTDSPTVGGKPTATIDRSKLIGVQWQLGLPTTSTPGCSGSITIDNVSFY
jgi:hypothetical protein